MKLDAFLTENVKMPRKQQKMIFIVHVEVALAERSKGSFSLSLELVSVDLLMKNTHPSPNADDHQFTTLIKNNPAI